jgi:hypothetical protein
LPKSPVSATPVLRSATTSSKDLAASRSSSKTSGNVVELSNPPPRPVRKRRHDGETDATDPALLACGAVAGPLYVAVTMAQALTRDGFD